MPRRASDLITIPGPFWQRADTIAALRTRDIGHLFQLLRDHADASQTQIAIACAMSQSKVSNIARGEQQVLTLTLFERIADGLHMPDPARIALGLAPRTASPPAAHLTARPRPQAAVVPARHPGPDLQSSPGSDLLDVESGGKEDDDPVRRRTFVGLTGAAMFSAILADPATATPAASTEHFAPLLAAPDTVPNSPGVAPDLAALTSAVRQTRRDYQACRYTDLTSYLPALLTHLHAAAASLTGDAQLRVFALSADAHHVAAGLLLKLDDQGLAYLAADRSMHAARASHDPITIGASARIITHTLMSGRHLDAATAAASTYAQRLDRDIPAHTPESLSVYGSLLLRGAIAAAQRGNRGTAHELLTEADDAARRLGVDGNLRWTAFGPINTRLHRVNIAVALGDAGTAIDVARGINLDKIAVTERKASLLIDTARAFLQWGKHDKAYLALRAAEETAHEEVADRPAVHRIVRDLVHSAPPTVRRDAEEFATRLGVSR
jgi:transcriptional regulator with XRE-family HTH domain